MRPPHERDYIINKEYFLKNLESKDYDYIGEFASLGGVPMYVLLQWVCEEFPQYKERAVKHMEELSKFYGYD